MVNLESSHFTLMFKDALNFYFHILDSPTDSIVYNAYKSDRKNAEEHGILNWSSQFSGLLEYYGFNHIWANEGTLNARRSSYAFVSKIKSEFIKYWNHSLDSQLHKDGSLSTYRLIKTSFGEAQYLSLVDSFWLRRYITKLRICDLKIEMNTLRYAKPSVPKHERLCKKCNLGKPGDEEHFLLHCPHYAHLRNLFLRQCIRQPFLRIVKSIDKHVLSNIGRFIFRCTKMDIR